MKIERALLSVTDKTGLVELARFLDRRGVELVSTGGTAAAIREAGVPVTEIAAVTGFPEIMDGRVKTLHPSVHGAILARRDADHHVRAMAEHGIRAIDLVVVNLYAFERTVQAGAGWRETVENIDIGGPALIRAAAKNHAFVTVVVDPADYGSLMEEMESTGGGTSASFRLKLAGAAYARTASYDAAVAGRFDVETGERFPGRLTLSGSLRQSLRYGENPHQEAALYGDGAEAPGVATARQVGGRDLSFNNLGDADAAFEAVCDFDPERDGPAVAIVKHGNPCGVALGATPGEAYARALACDSLSAFGGVVAANCPLDGDMASRVAEIFTEVVVAPDADAEALAVLARRKNLRVLLTGGVPEGRRPSPRIHTLGSGFLVQSRDLRRVTRADLKVVTRRHPTEAELDDMLFAFRVVKHVRSNAIVYARNRCTLGIGAGQMSRLDSALIARQKAERAGLPLEGSVVASDAYFPFPDGLLEAAQGGATAAIQPGGSVRDGEVVAAADERGMAMVMTGVRHFRH